MKTQLLCLLALFAVSPAFAQSPREEQLQSAAAQKILKSWQADAERSQKRFLHVFAWTPADRPFPADYQARLDRVLKHIQSFYASEMDRLGFGPLTINLPLTDDGHVLVHAVTGSKPYSEYEKASGDDVRKDCAELLSKQGIDADKETLLIFCNLAEWDPEKLVFSHKSPYYGGGTAANGTAWQLDSPELDIPNIKLKEPMIRDGEYGRISLGRHNSIFIGGMAHELGHGLGLPHCAPRPEERVRGEPIMGSGNRTYGEEMRGEGNGSFLSFGHALQLATHPQFSGYTKQMNTRPKVTASIKSIDVEGKGIHIKGNLKGEPPVYGVLAYFDPEGNSDYNATMTTAVPDEQGNFELTCDALEKGKLGELRIVPLHCNGLLGEHPKLRLTYRVDQEGTPDLSTAQIRLELAEFLEAYSGRDPDKAKRYLNQIKNPQGKAIARHLVGLTPPTLSPAEYKGREKVVPLTNFKPVSIEVGWMRGTFDRVPDSSVLLESADQIFERGLYAHAPAKHVFNLGGKWKKLTGQVGVADGHDGTVQFVITGDGNRLWQSELVQESKLIDFSVDVSNVKELTLTVDPATNGTAYDWGLWLNPELHSE